ncbi:deleted in malignant brain tumors 1 protein-like isoform X1 [Dreissena polymorpha]|uniref:deleted in malignant brain tumors 1 protein-like isoform X1 n=1 Tax=Dreissena polymorpha TaxID=45954 RepID=UPI0022652907|nr:deleted in malignant brain tumors 1 protein-like isoform X1 [Dreissena polymorpha]
MMKIGRLSLYYSSMLIIGIKIIQECAGQSSNGDIRLIDGGRPSQSQGRVEVFYNGTWGTVCDDNWIDQNNAIVVCRQMNSPSPNGGVWVNSTRFGAGSDPIWLDDVGCAATEQRLADCQHRGWGLSSGCDHSEDVGVICPVSAVTSSGTPSPTTTKAPVIPDTGNCTTPDRTIRLKGPSNMPGVGVVQLLRNNTWGNICDNGWGFNNAKVVCRMLCFNPNTALAGSVNFDTSTITEKMVIKSVTCTGNEANISACTQAPWADGSCSTSEMAKVTCTPLDNSAPTRPEPILECSNGLLRASFNKSRDVHLEPKHLQVANSTGSSCTASTDESDQYVSISIPFDECNTLRTYNATHIIYKNVIMYLPTFTSGAVSNTNTYMVQVQCELPRDPIADKPILPLTETVTQVAQGQFIVNMHFFRNNSFVTAVTNFPLEIPLGEWLNSALSLEDVDKNLHMVVPNCYATPSSSRNDLTRYPLFTDKPCNVCESALGGNASLSSLERCVNDQTVGFFPINDTWFGYRWQTFKFVQFPAVHIHCDAYVCAKDDPSPECDRSCLPANTTTPSSGRRKRDWNAMPPTLVHVSSGTLLVYKTEQPPLIERPPLPVQPSTTQRPETTPAPASTVAQVEYSTARSSTSSTSDKPEISNVAHVTTPADRPFNVPLVVESGARKLSSSVNCVTIFSSFVILTLILT